MIRPRRPEAFFLPPQCTGHEALEREIAALRAGLAEALDSLSRLLHRRYNFTRLCSSWAGAAVGGSAGALQGHHADQLWAYAANILLAAIAWWIGRRRGRGRAKALLSQKYRHVRDAMVRTLRGRSVQRPVLAPSP